MIQRARSKTKSIGFQCESDALLSIQVAQLTSISGISKVAYNCSDNLASSSLESLVKA